MQKIMKYDKKVFMKHDAFLFKNIKKIGGESMLKEEKTIKSKAIFQGKILNLRVDTVILPDGREATREIVEHKGASAIVAIDDNNNIYMIGQYRKPIDEITLEIPAGIMEDGEEAIECAKRELQEETGLSAKNWEKVLSYYSAVGFCNELIHVYLASDLQKGEENPDQDEFLDIQCMPLEEAYQSIFTGKIIDGKSIIGIQHAYSKFIL